TCETGTKQRLNESAPAPCVIASSEMMAGYRKDTVDFQPQSSQSAARGWVVRLGVRTGATLASSSNPLIPTSICLSRPMPAASLGKTGRGSGALPTCEQNFRRNIDRADARAEYRPTYRDHPVIMQHVLGDSA